MMEAICHCGANRFAVDHAPDQVTDYNCSLCHRHGVLWAYYSPRRVRQTAGSGETDVYLWGKRLMEFYRCRVCGCVTHWTPVDISRDRMASTPT